MAVGIGRLTNYKEPTSWEADNGSASYKITHSAYIPKDLFRFHNIPPLVPILSQMNPIYTPISCFFKINFNIIILSTRESSKWSLLFRVSY
jgi:hypothetical protein